MDFQELVSRLTPEMVASMKRAVELGKWPDGQALQAEQREQTLQAVMAWEMQNLPQDQRTGYMSQSCKSAAKHDAEKSADAGSDKSSDRELDESASILRFQDA